MAVSPFRPLGALMLSMALCGGCAGRMPASLAHRFVQPGTSNVDLGGPAPKPEKAPRAKTPKVQTPPGGSRATSLGLSVENSDKRLSSALLLEAAAPTPANHLRVAAEYRRLGILDASVRHIEAAIRVAPRFGPAHEAMAQIWREWGLPEQGLGAAYRATSYAPHSSSAQNTLGTLLAALGFTSEAREAYQRAVALDPAAAWVQNNLCDLERRAGQLAAAADRCRAALALDPKMSAAHNNLALTLAANGDLTAAREEFLAAGDDAAANYNMGLVHMADGDYASAADAFETAIRLRPSFTAAKRKAHTVRLYLLTGGK